MLNLKVCLFITKLPVRYDLVLLKLSSGSVVNCEGLEHVISLSIHSSVFTDLQNKYMCLLFVVAFDQHICSFKCIFFSKI